MERIRETLESAKTLSRSVVDAVQQHGRKMIHGLVAFSALSLPHASPAQDAQVAKPENGSITTTEDQEMTNKWNTLTAQLESQGINVPPYDPTQEGEGLLKPNIVPAKEIVYAHANANQKIEILNPDLQIDGMMMMPLPANIGDQRFFAFEPEITSQGKSILGNPEHIQRAEIIESRVSEDNPYSNLYYFVEFKNIKGDITIDPQIHMLLGEYPEVSREDMLQIIQENTTMEEYMQFGNAALSASQIVYDDKKKGNDLDTLFTSRDTNGLLRSDCGRKASLASALSPLLLHVEGYFSSGEPHVLNFGELPDGFFLLDTRNRRENFSVRPQTKFLITTVGKHKAYNDIPMWNDADETRADNIAPGWGVNDGFWVPDKGTNADFAYHPARLRVTPKDPATLDPSIQDTMNFVKMRMRKRKGAMQ